MNNIPRRYFRQKLEVLTKQRLFDHLEFGDCFTIPGDIGFGQIWVGFPVYVKIDEGWAINLSDGVRTSFRASAVVLLVRYGSIEKPEEES